MKQEEITKVLYYLTIVQIKDSSAAVVLSSIGAPELLVPHAFGAPPTALHWALRRASGRVVLRLELAVWRTVRVGRLSHC